MSNSIRKFMTSSPIQATHQDFYGFYSRVFKNNLCKLGDYLNVRPIHLLGYIACDILNISAASRISPISSRRDMARTSRSPFSSSSSNFFCDVLVRGFLVFPQLGSVDFHLRQNVGVWILVGSILPLSLAQLMFCHIKTEDSLAEEVFSTLLG